MQRKQNKIEKNINMGGKTKIAIVVSEYNSDITRKIESGAKNTLLRHGVSEKNIISFNVPGAFEIPITCKRIALSKKFDGIVAIGCVIKGDTDHYKYISKESTRGIMDVMLTQNIPITNAILTVNNLEQAKVRSQGEMNKGIEASVALLRAINLI